MSRRIRCHWDGARILAGLVAPTDPETEPGVIRRCQRLDVLTAALTRPDATPAELSALVVLPVAAVCIHLGLPVPAARSASPRSESHKDAAYRQMLGGCKRRATA